METDLENKTIDFMNEALFNADENLFTEPVDIQEKRKFLLNIRDLTNNILNNIRK